MKNKKFLITGGAGFTCTNPTWELDTRLMARPAHTPNNLKQRAIN